MNLEIQTLNRDFAIAGHIIFQTGPGGLTTVVVKNPHAEATITLAGAHVLTYTPHNEPPLLWTSPNNAYTIDEAMRGGIPICWPWFADHPTNPQELPLHGLVRTMPWTLSGTRACPDGSSEVRMVVRDTAGTRVVWPHPFELEVILTIGRTLRLEWIARNPGNVFYTYTGAYHPYFKIGEINAISLRGLEQTEYLDKTDAFRKKTQVEPELKITEETDRIYLRTTSDIEIVDPVLGRTIHLTKKGSHTSVVWNPGETDALMPDVGAGQNRCFVCVEAANAADEVITVAPGEEARLMMEIWTEQGVVS